LTEVRPPPDVFAAVMATGIVSIAAADHGLHRISAALALLAAVALPLLVVLAAIGWRRTPLDLHDPDVLLRLLTFVAACGVLAARLRDYRALGWVLVGLALAAWILLVPLIIRHMTRTGWTGLRDRAHGAWELASVATSGLAIGFADLDVRWLAMAFWVLALAVYGVITILIGRRTVHERLDRDGFEPDSWILMGGLAIATLAGDHIHRVWPAPVVAAVTVLTWILATLWIPPLAYFVVRRVIRHTETLRVAGVWWAMVFPLGMYSAATYAMFVELGWPGFRVVSLAFCWIALAAWLAVALLGRFVRL
jgi:tellurite resistance protein TehA-like permease